MTRSAQRSSANYEIINNSVLCDAAFFHNPVYDLPVTFSNNILITVFALILILENQHIFEITHLIIGQLWNGSFQLISETWKITCDQSDNRS